MTVSWGVVEGVRLRAAFIAHARSLGTWHFGIWRICPRPCQILGGRESYASFAQSRAQDAIRRAKDALGALFGNSFAFHPVLDVAARELLPWQIESSKQEKCSALGFDFAGTARKLLGVHQRRCSGLTALIALGVA